MTSFPDITVEEIKGDTDFLIVACDGIWDCLTSQQAVDFVYKTKAKLMGGKPKALGS